MADAGPGDESPSHPPSELSTIPNTPRPESLEPAPVQDSADATGLPVSPSSSSSGDNNRYEFQPTWPKMIDITKSAAVATWKDQRLSNLFLDLHWHLPSNKAFFKLRAPISMTTAPGRRDGKMSFYVFIYPERIRHLSTSDDSSERGPGAGNAILKFILDKPPALVVPNAPYEPRDAAAEKALAMLRSLASQTCFDIHASILYRELSVARLQELCTMVSGQNIASLSAHATAARLYQGRGGHVIEGDTLKECKTPSVPDEPPPEYCEPPSGESSASKSLSGQKRRRRSSSGLSTEEPSVPMTRAEMQSLMDANMSLFKKHVNDALALHQQEITTEVAAQVGQAETRILSALRGEMNNRCDGIQNYLEDTVYREMAEVEDQIMRNLTEAPLQATLTFPQHPWY